MTLLHTLPPDHPLRNTPLGEIRAEVRNLQSDKWRKVLLMRISQFDFNHLRGGWLSANEFRAPEPKEQP